MKTETDMVNQPPHYQGDIEEIERLDAQFKAELMTEARKFIE